MSLQSILDKLTTRQIAIGGGILVAVLLTLGTVAASVAGWQAFAAIAEKREKERIAKEQAKAVDDFKNAVAKVFGTAVRAAMAPIKVKSRKRGASSQSKAG